VNAATFLRSWPSASAWGAGLVMAALGAGAIIRPDSGVALRGLGAGLVGLGLAALVWGGVSLAAGRLAVVRTALAGTLVSLVATAALLFSAPAHTSVVGVAAASVLLVVVGATLAVHVRRRGAHAAPATARPMSVLGLLVAGAIIGVVVTPALSATQNAILLRDDGTVPVIDHHGH